MISKDFADQYKKNDGIYMSSNKSKRVLLSVGFTATVALLLFLIPSQKQIRIHEQISPPSSYQASLSQYLTILETHNNPSHLPIKTEQELKQIAVNALNLSSESKVYYPTNQKLSVLSGQLEQEIQEKFPDLIAHK